MNRPYVLGLLFALSLVSSVPRAHAATIPNVILSEIAWAGSAQSTADEWIELANVGAESVPLGGWQLTGVGTGGAVLTIPAETFLNAGSTYLISNYALGDPKSTLNIAPNLVTTAVSVPNTTLNVALLDATGATVDSLIDPGTPDAGSSATFASMERVLADLSWAGAETSTNLLNNQLGSPGVIGHTAATPVEIEILEEAPTESEVPIVTEIATDPAPIVLEEATVEIPDPIIDPVVVIEPIDETITDPGVETPVETAPTEPIVVSEPVEILNEEPVTAEMSIETPAAIEETLVEIPAAVEETPIETAAIIEIAQNEDEVEEEPEPLAIIHAGGLVISGVFPSPNTGDDEWVALTNTTDAAIDLGGITLVDASGAVTTLGDTIGAQTTIYVLNPKGKLNNNGDSVSLVDNAGTVISTAAYGTDEFPAPKKGTVLLFSSALIEPESIDVPPTQSYEESPVTIADTADATPAADATPPDLTTHSSGTRTARAVAVATTSTSIPATHSTPNIATRVTATTSSASSAKKTSTRSTSSRAASVAPRLIGIQDIGTLADDAAVTLEGIVVATPRTIGKRSFFLDGLEIYQSQGDLAAVSIGDHVRVTGTVSVLSDHRRVNIKTGGVTVLGTSSPVVQDYSDTLQYGSLVRVTGTVSARDGNAVVLRIDDEHSITIAPATGITVNWADLAGKTITVTGILKNSSMPAIVVLRNTEDITVSQETVEAAVAGTSSSNAFPWVGAGAAALVAAGFGAWIWWNRPRSSLTKLTLHPTTV